MSLVHSFPPLVAIVGATGTGKSQLAVDIARRFNGEVINGDAMQLYDGLPIITNKITDEERQDVPHHLLGCIGLNEETWTVGTFVKKASVIIDEIRSRGRLPVLVGGTHYYTQSLLFRETLASDEEASRPNEASKEDSRNWPILDAPTETILEELRRIDSIMADRWHPKERRKIQKSLEIYYRTGKTASKLYEEQRAKKQAMISPNNMEGSGWDAALSPLRYPTLMFWVYSSSDALNERLDSRVVKMLDNGLLSEVKELHKFCEQQKAQGREIDQGRGIWVSIGYKEFVEYQSALSSEDVQGKKLQALLRTGIQKTQVATRQYAKRQARWIRIKLFNALSEAGCMDRFYILDATDPDRWEESVLEKAAFLTSHFLKGEKLPSPSSISETAAELLMPKRDDISQRRDLWIRRTCEVCGVTAVIQNDWDLHIKSQSHRRAVKAKTKRENIINEARQEGPVSH
ncbi:IPP transferase-domain-containing protein [Lineolata rhizophorae]|uniref:tRNA dimethylallyltransferase n=1 Tax=Lineolata rhizophorae TaxID=578093 RepID=A0A6A6PDV1_9PEZI|nr:IPP transferase-domain-containing protein [Lineolata rhizophorae]